MANFYLMHQQQPVAILEIAESTADILALKTILDPERFPIGIAPHGAAPDVLSFRKWWRGRSIPASREGLKEALYELSVPYAELLCLKCNGLSLTDQYWITPCEQPQSWHKLNFFINDFSEDMGRALFGEAPSQGAIDLFSPCCTSDGFLKKRWTIQNGVRILLKAGTPPFYQEPLNECVASELYARLSINHVPYMLHWEQGKPLSACPCFVTADTDFVSAAAIMNAFVQRPEHTAWQHFLFCCRRLGIPGAEQAVTQMLAADYLLANTDRHLGNFGALRNAQTLEWIGMAPVFDSGTSLWQLDQTHFIPDDHYFPAKPFAAKQEDQLRLLDPSFLVGLPWGNLADLGQVSYTLLASSPFLTEERAGVIAEKLEQRVQSLVLQLGQRLAPGLEP